MSGLLFAHPEMLSPLAAGWVLIALALVLAAVRGRERLRLLLGNLDATRLPRTSRPLRDAAPLLAAALIAVGLLGPRAGESVVRLSTSGVDVVVLLDASRSMDVRDVPPSRMDAGRVAATKLLSGLSTGDRAALAAFAGRGLLLTPLTPDHAALRETLAAVDTSLVKPGGSDLSAGIATALRAFDTSENRPRAIFVISDGEVAGPGGTTAAGAISARRADTRVFGVAIGTEAGATVPDHGVPLRDSNGEIVTSRRRTGTLEALTEETGGHLFIADEWGHFDVDALVSVIRAPVAAVPGSFVAHRVTVPVVLPFAALAFGLLLVEWLSHRRSPTPHIRREHRTASNAESARSARSRLGRRAIPAVVLLGIALIGADAPETSTAPSIASATLERALVGGASGASLVRVGLDLAADGAWAPARRAFLAAAVEARSPDVTALAFHNLGVAALAQDDLEGARDAFFDSLAAGGTSTSDGEPERRHRTQWNLEWALTELAKGAHSGPSTTPPEDDLPPAKTPADESDRSREDPRANPASDPGEERREHEGTQPEQTGADSENDEAADTAESGNRAPEPTRAEAAATGETRLDEAEREQWLARITDDPRKALLSAAFDRDEERNARADGSRTW